jgi:hypothetical protein
LEKNAEIDADVAAIFVHFYCKRWGKLFPPKIKRVEKRVAKRCALLSFINLVSGCVCCTVYCLY